MATTGMRLGLADLVAAGGRAISRYTGTVFAVFVVQSLIAAACMVGVAAVLAKQFAQLPMFDKAVDGDLAALIGVVLHARPSMFAIGGIVFGTLVLWQLVSWFLAGGLYGVFAQRPEGRSDTARVFGASGVATYLAYARLAVCSLVGWAVIATVFVVTKDWMMPRFARALDLGDLALPLFVTLAPTVLLLHYFSTVTDYARAELALRCDSHRPGVVLTYGKTLVYVARRPLTLVHGAFGWLLFGFVTVAYAAIAAGHPMYGAAGAITLFIARQGVALLRLVIRAGVMGGQLELARTRPLPPRRVEEPETKPPED